MNGVIDQMVREAGVEILYQTKVTGVRKSGDTVTGIETDYGSCILADVVIDATGDGHVAHFAGAPTSRARKATDLRAADHALLPDGRGGDREGHRFHQPLRGRLHRGLRPASCNELYANRMPFTLLAINSIREKAAAEGKYPIPLGTTTVNPRAHTSIARPAFAAARSATT